MKTKRNWKWKITHTDLERRTLFFSSCKNRQLKVKLWWVAAGKRKKSLCFVPFLLSEEIFFKCIVYWRHVQNIHAFTHPQILLDTLFYLFLKSSKAFSVSLKRNRDTKAYKTLPLLTETSFPNNKLISLLHTYAFSICGIIVEKWK